MKIIVNGESVDIPSGAPSGGESLPIGSVIMWAGTLETIPTGWHLCNGEDGTIDLRGMFALGAGGAYNLGDSGGSEEVTLTVNQIPEHTHTVKNYLGGTFNTSLPSGAAQTIVNGGTIQNITGKTGSSESHNNMPPYKALYYIQKIA